MTGQTFVEKRVVCTEQIKNAAVLVEHALEEKIRFLRESGAQVFVEIGKRCRVRQYRVDVPEIQPLAYKIRHERIGTRIRQHAFYLLRQDCGIFQLASLRRAQ